MKVKVVYRADFEFAGPNCVLLLPIFEDAPDEVQPLLDAGDAAVLQRLVERGVFAGKAQDVYYVPSAGSNYRGALAIGLGKRAGLTPELVRRATGKGCEALRQNRAVCAVVDASKCQTLPITAFVEGVVLGQYRFSRYRSPKDNGDDIVDEMTILAGSAADVAILQDLSDATVAACASANWARDLANMAPNELTPSSLADQARAMAAEAGCACEILDETRLADLGMNAILGVARGSKEQPRFIILSHRHKQARKTVAIVGKGVTFDAGGISIKPSQDMHEMKMDMCGAAAVLGAMKTICELDLPINVVCLAPAVENLLGSHAQRPGDIVKAYNGTTIEVNNTDAEGRLILADALAYAADKYKPDVMVDLATLTGAAVVALGHYAAAAMTDDDALYEALESAGETVGERLWRLPLWDDYDKLIEGTHADICNIGPSKEAGTIVGGRFLKHFAGGVPWAHLDIAGSAWGAKYIPYLDARSASGYGVRLLTQWLIDLADGKNAYDEDGTS